MTIMRKKRHTASERATAYATTESTRRAGPIFGIECAIGSPRVRRAIRGVLAAVRN